MGIRRRISILTVFIAAAFCCRTSSAQSTVWGAGIVIPEKGISELAINMPYTSFELLDSPGGKKAGTIFMKNSLNLVYSLNSKMIVCRVSADDITEVAAHGYCLKYYQAQGDFIKVLQASTGTGLWLSRTELKYLHLAPQDWFSFLVTRKSGFHPVVDIGLNLRQEPDAAGKKIVLMKGDRYMIDLDGQTDGLWAKVTVKRFASRPCASSDPAGLTPLEQLSGWIKIVDDKGFPNIWFYPHGCK